MNNQLRGVWLAFALLTAGVAGIVGGSLDWLDGGTLAGAVITGGATFVSAATFIILILKVAGRFDSTDT